MKQRVIPNNFAELDSLYKKFRQSFKRIEKLNFQTLYSRAISPNALTSRFQMLASEDHQSFVFIHLPIYEQLLSQMQPIFQLQSGKYYLEGPQGFGKSFALLNMVLETRMQKDKYRVIYVNNPDLWMRSPDDYIINEMIWAFMDDHEAFPACDATSLESPLHQWDKRLRSSKNKEADFKAFLSAAREYCDNQNLHLISFMDQENLIELMRNQNNHHFFYHFPFSYYQDLPHVSVQISFASSNNHTKIERTGEWINLAAKLKISFQDFCFSTEIIKLIVNRFFSEQGIKDKGLAQQTLCLTGRNSYEVALLLKHCSENRSSIKNIQDLKEQIYLHWTYRCQELLDSHIRFRNTYPDQLDSEKKFLNAATYADTDLEAPKDVLGFYDKNLMYQRHGKFWSLSPIAKGILSSDLEYQTDSVENLLSDYMRQDLKGQGEIFQRYILHSVTKIKNERKALTLKYTDVRTNEPGRKIFNIKEVEILVTIPVKKPALTTLYIPLLKDYISVDSVIYDRDDNRLYPIQITLTQKNHKGCYQKWKTQAEKEWLHVFEGCQVKFVWMVGVPKKYTREGEDYWEITIESLSETNFSYFNWFRQHRAEIQLKLSQLDTMTIDVEENRSAEIKDEF